MITFQILADVNADRQILLALPPEVPTGKVEIAIAVACVPAVVEQQASLAVPEVLEPLAAVEDMQARSIEADAQDDTPDDAPQEPPARAEARLARPEELPAEDGDGSEIEDAAEMLVPGVAGPVTVPARGPVEAAHAAAAVAEPAASVPTDAAPQPEPARPALAPPRRTVRPATTTTLQLPLVLGDYRLSKKLGQGCLGTVYAAQQLRLGRDVALKLLGNEWSADAGVVERFVQHAQRMARLDHRNILHCLEVGEVQGRQFVSMDLVQDGSSAAWLSKRGKLPIGDSLFILLGCCEGLQYAHELNVIHGGIKPSNVLLGARSLVKVADVGLSRALNGDLGLTASAAAIETLLYMAPEQDRPGNHADQRSDLYALGCLLYAFLTGEPPFKAQTRLELLKAKQSGRFTPAAQLNPDVPEALDRILHKLLAVNPDDRQQSCAELVLDLDRLGLARKGVSFTSSAPSAPSARAQSSATPLPQPRELHMHELQGVEGYWYLSMKGPEGKAIIRKVTYRQLLALIKRNEADAETASSRTRNGGYQALGSYPEFHHLARGRLGTLKLAEHGDMAGGPRPEQSAKKRIDRRRWLQGLLGRRRGRARLLVLGGALAVLGGGLFFLSHTFWFWRLKRAVASWFR